MSYRVQWREFGAHLKTPAPGDIKWEEGHDPQSAASRASELIASDAVCWVNVQDLDKPFLGNSSEKPKQHKGGKK